MFITSVKLKNFGRHESLDLDIGRSPIVGLLGPNGCGKSTFLAALELMFTMNLKDNFESYIRNGEKQAKVEIEFIKGGMVGKISRQIGGSDKKLMEWDGNKYTKISDIENALKDILGADKKATANIIFINQGELDDLLFGDQAAREKMFIKVVLMSHLEKVCEVAEGKIKHLQAGMQDFTALKDEVESEMNLIKENKAKVSSELQDMPNRENDLAALQGFLTAKDALDGLRKEAQDAEVELRQLDESITALLGETGLNTIDELKAKVNAMNDEWKILTEEISDMKDYKNLLVNHDNTERDLSNAKSEVESLKTTLETYRLDSDKDVTAINRAIEEEQERRSFESTLRDSDKLLAEIQAELDTTLKTPLVNTQEDIDKTEAEVEQKRDAWLKAKQKHEVLKSVLDHKVEDNVCSCPVCDQAISGDLFSEETVWLWHEKKKELYEVYINRSADLEKMRSELKGYEDKIHDIVNRLNTAKTKNKLTVEKLEGREAQDLDALISERDKVITASTMVKEFSAKLKQAEDKLVRLEPLLVSIISDMKNSKVASEFDSNVLAEKTAKKDNLNTAINNWQQVLTNLQQSDIKRTNVEARKNAATSRAVNSEKEVSESEKSIEDKLGMSPTRESEERLKAIQSARQEVIGRISQMDTMIERKETRLRELDEQMESNRTKQDVINELRQLKDAFARKGLPLAYVNHKFKMLVELAQMNLSEMDANFSVNAHPETPVSFQFVRTDEDEEYVMDMSKLSGGQRVRLTVAFLLAVQQMIVPDVGLLVLDEPSVHLDAEGVNSMKELLLSMSAKLNSSECQVWICDHNEVLEPAFDYTINLK
jgi:exonuclease SbcC